MWGGVASQQLRGNVAAVREGVALDRPYMTIKKTFIPPPKTSPLMLGEGVLGFIVDFVHSLPLAIFASQWRTIYSSAAG